MMNESGIMLIIYFLKGLDATTGFTPKEVKGRLVGDADLRRHNLTTVSNFITRYNLCRVSLTRATQKFS